MDGDLFMVMGKPLRKGNSECEWKKAEKIHNIESIMVDIYNHFYNVRNKLCCMNNYELSISYQNTK